MKQQFIWRLGRILTPTLILMFVDQSLASERLSAKTGTTVLKGSKTDFGKSKLMPDFAAVGLQTGSYVSAQQASFGPGARAEQMAVNIDVASDWRLRSKTHFRLQLRNEYSAIEQWNYFKPYEAYFHLKKEQTELSLGRKREKFSDWEERWGQGIFNPRYLNNQLRSEPAGLVGGFASHQIGSWSGLLAVLPLHIPSQGPGLRVVNDRFESRNPWFRSPASQFIYRGEPGEIRYSLEQNQIDDVIYHAGVAAKLDWQTKSAGARLSYAYKPMPNFVLGFPSEDRVTVENDNDIMQVSIYPRVVYHRLLNLDVRGQNGPWAVSGSVASENPVNDPAPKSWTTQRLGETWMFSGELKRDLDPGPSSGAHVALGFLRANGANRRDSGLFAGQSSLFERHLQFFEAYMISGEFEMKRGLRFPVRNQARVIYDRLQNGGVLSLTSRVLFTRNWQGQAELDFLGLMGAKNQIGDGFLSNYRANDRFGLGMTYVF